MAANGGSCFLPLRMAHPLIEEGRLFLVQEGPEFPHPAYMVFPREADSDVLRRAVEGLRELVQQEFLGHGKVVQAG
jgi:DNA-binding transcriptional LysR family regulator